MAKEKKRRPWWLKILLGFTFSIGGIIALAIVAILTLNVAKYVIYMEYYALREIVCTNHGMSDNYVSQGTAITEDGKYVITSGYMSDKTNSRIYITEIETDETHYVSLHKENGNAATYHFGGVATEDNLIYLASNDAIWTVKLDEALENDSLNITKLFEVNNQASFVFTDDDYIYVGEFNDDKQYKTNNSYTYNGVTYKAIVEMYDRKNPTSPLKVLAIPNKIQGFAITPYGHILTSSSFGLTSSQFAYFMQDDIKETSDTMYGAQVFVLETPFHVVSGPAMSEDLDFYDGKFYTNFESSCNKYIFGKFFLDSNKIVALDFEKFA